MIFEWLKLGLFLKKRFLKIAEFPVFVDVTTPTGRRAKIGFKLASFGFVPFWVLGDKSL